MVIMLRFGNWVLESKDRLGEKCGEGIVVAVEYFTKGTKQMQQILVSWTLLCVSKVGITQSYRHR